MVIFFPIFWVFLPLCNQQLAHKLGIAYFSDEFKLVNFLALFFGTFFVFITGFFIIVTIWNNLHFKHAVAQKETNRSMMRSRRGHVVELACQQHFGDKAQRQAAHFYQVEGNQNFDNNYIQNLFELNEVDQ
ncbi:hypothetical protein KIM322_01920 [Lactobacillus xylocopicola]|uniref:Uncharacterized protein n=2 Tax=Lactobacillus xylocopicola TaxID=2976676 RepID=A0ABM8BFA9_9LACO|nr:hypothetical protein KIM322_01920 [Lactobacillus xylocopicola]